MTTEKRGALNGAPRVVIIDGPDGSGKSTLSKKLQEKFVLGYSHDKGDLPDVKDDRLLQHYLNAIRAGGVIDRSIMSEMVFGPLLRKKLRTDNIGAVMRELEKQNGHYILCLPSPEVCMVHWSERAKTGNEFITDPQLFMWSYARFAYLARDFDCYARFSVYDRIAETHEELIQRIWWK